MQQPQRGIRKANQDIAKRVGVPGWDDRTLDVLDIVKEWFEGERSGKCLIV